MERADIVVVGGGAAGLAAAAEASRQGRRVVLLEARDRLGGRVETHDDTRAPVPVELGAEFIHNRPAELDELVRAAGLATYAPDGDHFALGDRGLARVDGYWELVADVLGSLGRPRGGGSSDRSAAEFLAERAQARGAGPAQLASDYVQGFHAADPARIGTEYLAAAEGAGAAAGAVTERVLAGYARVIDELAARAGGDLRPRTVVDTIRWSADGAEVHACSADGGEVAQIATRHVVVTVPLGVLIAPPGSRGAIRFDPEPDDHLDAARAMAMGQVAKAVLVFRDPFWEEHDAALRRLSFLHLPRRPFPTWWSLHPIRSGMLVGWAGGPAATALAGRSHEQLRHAALQSLADAFGIPGADLRARLIACWTKDWSADPFARGAYAYVPVGASWAPRRLAEPARGTLFFAGEAINPDLALGSVDAAIASGRRAAGAAAGA
jgi:monoamine oxidase